MFCRNIPIFAVFQYRHKTFLEKNAHFRIMGIYIKKKPSKKTREQIGGYCNRSEDAKIIRSELS